MAGILPLTTIDNAVAYFGSTGQGVQWTDANKAVLSKMILAISQAFENYSSHGFLLADETESWKTNTDFVWCYRWPVTSIASVSVSATGRKSGLAPFSGEYKISPNEKGILIYDVPEGALVQATYHGGLAADTASLISSYPDLEDLTLLQLVSEWKRHTMPDRTGVDLGGTGNTQWNGEIKLLSHVELRLDQNYVSQADFL